MKCTKLSSQAKQMLLGVGGGDEVYKIVDRLNVGN